MECAADLRSRAGGSVDHFRRNLATTAMAAAARNAGWIADRPRRARREDGGPRDGRDHIHDSRGGARIAESIRGYGTSAYFLAVLWSAACFERRRHRVFVPLASGRRRWFS